MIRKGLRSRTVMAFISFFILFVSCGNNIVSEISPKNGSPLRQAITNAEEARKDVVESPDGKQVPANTRWVKPEVMKDMDQAITRAYVVYEDPAATEGVVTEVIESLTEVTETFTSEAKQGNSSRVYPVVSTLDRVVTGYESLDAAISGAGTGSRITLYANQIIANGTGLANKTLTLTGYGENRNITHEPGAAMFTLAGSDRLILDANITLDGEGSGSSETSVNDNQKQPLVSVTGATLEMMGNATITGLRNGQNDTEQDVPGAVYIQGGILVMSGNSRITNSRANAGKGGGVHINGGSLTMKDNAVIGGTDGAATENVATWGGGVYVGNGGSLTMNGRATITGNRATIGGGVALDGGAIITMNDDAVITNNNITKWGGGVYMNGGTFTMNGNTGISGNWANSDLYEGRHGPGEGGGVHIKNGTFTMAGGTITGNSAQYTHNSRGLIGKGGGVYITGGTFAIPVGDLSTYVSGNSTDNSDGDQIYKNSGTFKIGEVSQEGGSWN